MEGLIINYNNFNNTPFQVFNGDISSSEYYKELEPSYKVRIISNTDIRIVLSSTTLTGIDYETQGIYVPKDTYFEFEAHMLRKHFYCSAITQTSDIFVCLTYITGFVVTP